MKNRTMVTLGLAALSFVAGIKYTQLKLRDEVDTITQNVYNTLDEVAETAWYESYYETLYECGVDLDSMPEEPTIVRDYYVDTTQIKYRGQE